MTTEGQYGTMDYRGSTVINNAINLPIIRPGGTVITPLVLSSSGFATASMPKNIFNSMQWITETCSKFRPFFDSLDRISCETQNWLRRETDRPEANAIEKARFVLDRLLGNGLCPNRVMPTGEGGIGILFGEVGSKYADIECSNSDKIIFLTSDGNGEIHASEVSDTFEGVNSCIVELRQFFSA